MRFCVLLLVTLFAVPGLQAQTLQTQALSNGIQATASGITVQVTALRDDVLRVRATHTATLPEDASWAVLPAARTATVQVTAVPGGFRTAALQIMLDADLRLTVADLSGHILQQDAEPITWHNQAFRVTKQKDPNDHFFGLGDKTGPLDRAGMSFTMWNTDSFGFQESTDPIYKSIPFFLNLRNGRALGVLFDNTFRSFFDFGHQDPGQYTFSAPDGPANYYLLYGPTPKQVVETYAWLTGPTPLPPLWSLGFQQSRYSYEPEAKVIQIADRLRSEHIPADAIYLDIDYQDKNRPFTVDPIKFPHFAQMMQQLTQKQLHTVVITDLHIAHLPHAGYAPYDSGTAGDHFVKNPDGSTYIGPVWPGPSVFPDFTRKVSRDWWGTLYAGFVAQGVAGFWNDMNEPAVFTYPTKTMPDTVQHRIDEPGFKPRTATHLEIHNVFGMENSRGTYEGLLKLQPNQRPFVLTRASYAGGQRYAATWTGDNSSTWNHMRLSIAQIVNLGLSGFAFSGADVGGFAGSPSPDLLTKWLELAAFQPIDRDHAAKGTIDHEPWADLGPALPGRPDHLALRRRYIEERYRLMPYLYTVAEEMSRTGLPIDRPLFLEFPNATTDGHPLDLDAGSEFLLGASLLIAPNPSPEEVAPYEVHLPPGIWYDYWTGEKLDRRTQTGTRDLEIRDAADPAASSTNQAAAAPNKPLLVTPTLADLPVYVREGTILPIAPLTQSTAETPQGPLTLRVYPGRTAEPGKTAELGKTGLGAGCSGDLYQDDGISFAFRSHAFYRLHMTCTENSDGSLRVHLDAPEGSFKPWFQQLRIEAYGWTPKARQATTPTGTQPLQPVGKAWAFTLPAPHTATDLLLR